jgi:hypothetical protein
MGYGLYSRGTDERRKARTRYRAKRAAARRAPG